MKCKCIKTKNQICLLKNPSDEECMNCNKPDIYLGKVPKNISRSDIIQKSIAISLEEIFKNSSSKG